MIMLKTSMLPTTVMTSTGMAVGGESTFSLPSGDMSGLFMATSTSTASNGMDGFSPFASSDKPKQTFHSRFTLAEHRLFLAQQFKVLKGMGEVPSAVAAASKMAKAAGAAATGEQPALFLGDEMNMASSAAYLASSSDEPEAGNGAGATKEPADVVVVETLPAEAKAVGPTIKVVINKDSIIINIPPIKWAKASGIETQARSAELPKKAHLFLYKAYIDIFLGGDAKLFNTTRLMYQEPRTVTVNYGEESFSLKLASYVSGYGIINGIFSPGQKTALGTIVADIKKELAKMEGVPDYDVVRVEGVAADVAQAAQIINAATEGTGRLVQKLKMHEEEIAQLKEQVKRTEAADELKRQLADELKAAEGLKKQIRDLIVESSGLKVKAKLAAGELAAATTKAQGILKSFEEFMGSSAPNIQALSLTLGLMQGALAMLRREMKVENGVPYILREIEGTEVWVQLMEEKSIHIPPEFAPAVPRVGKPAHILPARPVAKEGLRVVTSALEAPPPAEIAAPVIKVAAPSAAAVSPAAVPLPAAAPASEKVVVPVAAPVPEKAVVPVAAPAPREAVILPQVTGKPVAPAEIEKPLEVTQGEFASLSDDLAAAWKQIAESEIVSHLKDELPKDKLDDIRSEMFSVLEILLSSFIATVDSGRIRDNKKVLDYVIQAAIKKLGEALCQYEVDWDAEQWKKFRIHTQREMITFASLNLPHRYNIADVTAGIRAGVQALGSALAETAGRKELPNDARATILKAITEFSTRLTTMETEFAGFTLSQDTRKRLMDDLAVVRDELAKFEQNVREGRPYSVENLRILIEFADELVNKSCRAEKEAAAVLPPEAAPVVVKEVEKPAVPAPVKIVDTAALREDRGREVVETLRKAFSRDLINYLSEAAREGLYKVYQGGGTKAKDLIASLGSLEEDHDGIVRRFLEAVNKISLTGYKNNVKGLNEIINRIIDRGTLEAECYGLAHQVIRLANLIDFGEKITSIGKVVNGKEASGIRFGGWVLKQDAEGSYLIRLRPEEFDPQELDADGYNGSEHKIIEIKSMKNGERAKREFVIMDAVAAKGEAFGTESIIRVEDELVVEARLAQKFVNQILKIGAAVRSPGVQSVEAGEFHITTPIAISGNVVRFVQGNVPNAKIVVYEGMEQTRSEARIVSENKYQTWVRRPDGSLDLVVEPATPEEYTGRIEKLQESRYGMPELVGGLGSYSILVKRLEKKLSEFGDKAAVIKRREDGAVWDDEFLVYEFIMPTVWELNESIAELSSYKQNRVEKDDPFSKEMVGAIDAIFGKINGLKFEGITILEGSASTADLLENYSAAAADLVKQIGGKRELDKLTVNTALYKLEKDYDHANVSAFLEALVETGEIFDLALRPQDSIASYNTWVAINQTPAAQTTAGEWERLDDNAAKRYFDKAIAPYQTSGFKGFGNWDKHTPDVRRYQVIRTLIDMSKRRLQGEGAEDTKKAINDFIRDYCQGKDQEFFPIAREFPDGSSLKTRLLNLVKRIQWAKGGRPRRQE